MFTIKENTKHELIIKHSRFITLLFKVNTIDDINKFLEEARINYPKANHYTYAFRLINSAGKSDDGEPVNTAGAPILNVLEKENLVNTLCIVIRYFGGIKLGAGGLIRAYTLSTTDALKQNKKIALVKGIKVKVVLDYQKQKEFDYLMRDEIIVKKEFDQQVTYELLLKDDSLLSGWDYQILDYLYIELNE